MISSYSTSADSIAAKTSWTFWSKKLRRGPYSENGRTQTLSSSQLMQLSSRINETVHTQAESAFWLRLLAARQVTSRTEAACQWQMQSLGILEWISLIDHTHNLLEPQKSVLVCSWSSRERSETFSSSMPSRSNRSSHASCTTTVSQALQAKW